MRWCVFQFGKATRGLSLRATLRLSYQFRGVFYERPGSILSDTGCSILIAALIGQQRVEMLARRSVRLSRFLEKGHGVGVVAAAGALAEENAADNV